MKLRVVCCAEQHVCSYILNVRSEGQRIHFFNHLWVSSREFKLGPHLSLSLSPTAVLLLIMEVVVVVVPDKRQTNFIVLHILVKLLY